MPSADNCKHLYFFLSSIHIKFPKRIIDRIKYKYKRPKRYDWNSKKENPKNAFIYGDIPRYGNTGCGVFKRGINLEIFLPKNQHTPRTFLNFDNWPQ